MTNNFVLLFLFVCLRLGFSCSYGCLGTHSVDQASLELRHSAAPASLVLGLTVFIEGLPTERGCCCIQYFPLRGGL